MLMPVPVGALISAGVGLLGIGNSIMNQNQQQENFEEQLRFAKYMYEDTKKYNSMPAQVARMRAAGINPALAIGSGQLGSVQSPVSQPSAPTPVSLGVGETLSGMASTIQAEGQREVNIQEAQRIGINNETQRLKNMVDIMDVISQLEKRGIDSSNARELLKQNEFITAHQQEQFNQQIALQKAQTDWYDSQSTNNELLSYKLKFDNAHMQEEFTKRMNLMDKQAFNAYYSAIAAGKSADAALKSAEAVYYDAHKVLGVPEDRFGGWSWQQIVNGKIDELKSKSYLPNTTSETHGFNALGSGRNYSRSKTRYRKYNE